MGQLSHHLTGAVPAKGQEGPFPQPAAKDRINLLFAMFHGAWGQRWLSKWTTGQLDDQGHDKGVTLTIGVWRRALANYTDDEVRAAAEKAVNAGGWPPDLGEFRSRCENEAARRPPPQRLAYDPVPPTTEQLDALKARARAVRMGLGGPSTLLQLAANAVATATGEDEAAILRRMEKR